MCLYNIIMYVINIAKTGRRRYIRQLVVAIDDNNNYTTYNVYTRRAAVTGADG